jgi:DNA-binding NarL/FixJ family response regulator
MNSEERMIHDRINQILRAKIAMGAGRKMKKHKKKMNAKAGKKKLTEWQKLCKKYLKQGKTMTEISKMYHSGKY